MRIVMPLAYFFLMLGIVGLSGCGQSDDMSRPDVSHIEVDTQIRRFEQDLFAVDTMDPEGYKVLLDTNYGDFSRIFFEQVMQINIPGVAPEGAGKWLVGFTHHPASRHLFDTIQQVFPDLKSEKKRFDEAFRYLKYYFPYDGTPVVTTFTSEFSLAAFIYDDYAVAVGLDFCLGEGFPYTTVDPSNPIFSNYLTRTYNRDHLVTRALKPMVEDLVGPPSGDRLLDHIIREGKVMYMMDFISPSIPDTARLEFSADQLSWLRDNERNIWSYITSEQLLYETDKRKYRKYVEYSPHSPGMPPEAPGRTGSWIGFQIVKSWLKRHPESDIRDLLAMNDSQQILDAARYKPRR